MISVTDGLVSPWLLTGHDSAVRIMYNGNCSWPEISSVFTYVIVNKWYKINQSCMQAYSEMSLAYHR